MEKSNLPTEMQPWGYLSPSYTRNPHGRDLGGFVDVGIGIAGIAAASGFGTLIAICIIAVVGIVIAYEAYTAYTSLPKPAPPTSTPPDISGPDAPQTSPQTDDTGGYGTFGPTSPSNVKAPKMSYQKAAMMKALKIEEQRDDASNAAQQEFQREHPTPDTPSGWDGPTQKYHIGNSPGFKYAD